MNIISSIENLLKEARYETARRVCYRELSSETTPEPRNELLLLLHVANRHLGDIIAAGEALDQVVPTNEAQKFEMLLRRAEDSYQLTESSFYRTSPEAELGLTHEQYSEQKENLARKWLEEAIALNNDSEVQRVRKISKKLNLPVSPAPIISIEEEPVTTEYGSILGILRFPNGRPVANAKVTLATGEN